MIATNGIIASSGGSIAFSNTKSMLFDGVNEWVDTADIAAADGGTKLTVSCWAKTAGAGDRGLLAKWDYQTQGAWAFEFIAGDAIRVFLASALNAAGGENGVTNNTFANGTWRHILFVYDGDGAANTDKLKIYVNAVNQTLTYSSTMPTVLPAASSTVKIGRFGGTLDRVANGHIDEPSIWNKSFSAGEVTELYNAGVPTNLSAHSASANLVAWWRMGDGATWDGTNWSVPDVVGAATGTSVNLEEADVVLDVP